MGAKVRIRMDYSPQVSEDDGSMYPQGQQPLDGPVYPEPYPGGGYPPSAYAGGPWPAPGPQPWPGYGAPEWPAAPRPDRRWIGSAVAGVLALVCLVTAIVSGAAINGELKRKPTALELDRAATIELARRWQVWSAGTIFPAHLGYTLDIGGDETASRVGIDPGTSCAKGVDVVLKGCRAVLRATYLDQLEGMAITVGVLAFPDDRSAQQAQAKLPSDSSPAPGLRALGLPGSVVARFGDGSRQASAVSRQGPYIVMAVIGYADGRPTTSAKQKQTDLYVIAPQLANAVLRPLASRVQPACGKPGWQC